MSRITYKMVKQWLSESTFAQQHGMKLHCWNGYCRILDDCNNQVCSGKTPGVIWEKFNLLKTGYEMGLTEGKNERCN